MQKLFVAVRKSIDGHEWLDTDNSSFNYDLCKQAIKKANTTLPEWNKANPIIRISEFELTEKLIIERIVN